MPQAVIDKSLTSNNVKAKETLKNLIWQAKILPPNMKLLREKKVAADLIFSFYHFLISLLFIC